MHPNEHLIQIGNRVHMEMACCVRKRRTYCSHVVLTSISIVVIYFSVHALLPELTASGLQEVFSRIYGQRTYKRMCCSFVTTQYLWDRDGGIKSCLTCLQRVHKGNFSWVFLGKETEHKPIEEIMKQVRRNHNIKINSNKIILIEQQNKSKRDTQNNSKQTNTEPKYITLHKNQMGRLGNQMFQVATLLGLANLTGHVPFIQHRLTALLDVFDIPSSIYKTMDKTNFKEYNERISITSHDFARINWDYNWILNGYFQSYKYFYHIKDKFRNMFKFKKEFEKQSMHFLSSKVPKDRIKIGLHVRRGDFMTLEEQINGRMTPTLDYYIKAMDFYRCLYENATFIIVSDDKRWCRKNLKAPDTVFSTHNHGGADLALLTMCDHTIMSVGTYGWWGGLLAGGTVVYYTKPFRPGSRIHKTVSVKDFYPPEWIGLS